jgi:fructokinase
MLISCGDALIDFVPTRNAEGREALMPAVGGSCLNVAIGMARLGAPTGFVGGISTDMFGRMIADHAAASNVELALANRSDHQTTLAFVRIVVARRGISETEARQVYLDYINRTQPAENRGRHEVA